jgi:creatinine amidohydrolase/Fe(II)-dependent formamide hydrolase-like protein
VSPAASAAAGREGLAARLRALPDLLRTELSLPTPVLPFDPRGARRIRTTGLGSSESHARWLAHLLAERVGLDARFLPTSALRDGAPADAGADVLVIFSQGLSPNARFALEDLRAWRGVVLATAVPAGEDRARDAGLHAVSTAGGLVLRFGGAGEYGSLVRVTGPMLGLAAGLRLARSFAAATGAPDLEPPLDAICERVARAEATIAATLTGVPETAFEAPLAYLVSGAYAELVSNLQLKWLEGLLAPLPPVWDLLAFAHGPFQQAYPARSTFLALALGDTGESELLARAASMLDPDRHRIVSLASDLPKPFSLFEHEALLDALVLRRMEAQGVDPARWPGRGEDGALYALAPAARAASASPPRSPTRLEALTWPELEERATAGSTTAVVALGATEQHGPHLPLAADTWIADALAERFCARVPEALRLPALALGCSAEHLGFPGTLSLRAETLCAVLGDCLACLARHGFLRAFVFSAHGGNAAPLRDCLEELRATAAPMEVTAFTDLSGLTRALHAVAADHGVSPSAAGHHAGEVETSILAALAPASVRRHALAPGLLHDGSDAQAYFYPDLRAHAPNGTVGDPRTASRRRAADYLDTWTELLVACYDAGNP